MILVLASSLLTAVDTHEFGYKGESHPFGSQTKKAHLYTHESFDE